MRVEYLFFMFFSLIWLILCEDEWHLVRNQNAEKNRIAHSFVMHTIDQVMNNRLVP